MKEKVTAYVQSIKPVDCILNTIPILKWLPEYRWKRDLINDIISGTTVAIIHIPQGFAYALLGNNNPIVGIYMAFFPVLIYTIFGTSRHVSMGTFAITCLMAGQTVKDHATYNVLPNGTEVPFNPADTGGPHITTEDVAVTLSFASGALMVIMWALHLGIVASLMSETMVSAFTCGSAFYVVAAQFKDLLGLKKAMRNGFFSLYWTIYDMIDGIPHSNVIVITMSTVTLAILFAYDLYLKKLWSKRSRLPIPLELIVIVIGTIVVFFTGIDKSNNIDIVGHVPKGLPEWSVPTFSLLPRILLDSIILTMVSYATTMSLALMFAKKNMYEVDPNQDLLGQGLSNLAGAFSTCLPVAACLSRSMIQESVGGMTQIAGVVSCALLLILLLWAGPVLETAPKCVLAATIVVACKGLIMQIRDFPRYWRLSRWDGMVWAVTFLTTILIDISVGLGVGIVASLISIAIRGLKTRAYIVGRIDGTEIYLNVKKHKTAIEINDLKIFRYIGGLNFASKDSFNKFFVKAVGMNPTEILRKRTKFKETGLPLDENEDIVARGIIIDLAALTFIDPSGVAYLKSLQADFEKLGVVLYIVCSSAQAYEVISTYDEEKPEEKKLIIFPTVHDAVLYFQNTITPSDASKQKTETTKV